VTKTPRPDAPSFGLRSLLWSLAVGAPGTIVALILLWTREVPVTSRWVLSISVIGAWIGLALYLKEQIVHPLRTMANLLAGLREGDYSVRLRTKATRDPLGLVFHEINTLGETLHRQRLDAVEAAALLAKVMETIDVAAFTFDGTGKLKLVNRSGQELLNEEPDELIGKTAESLGLQDCLSGSVPRVLDRAFPGQGGRFELRRSEFRESGLPHQLIVLSDLTRTLRQEERQAWQRLVQVLRHEINNSLAPIQSLAGTLKRLANRDPKPDDWRQDLEKGLTVIADRSGALSRFMASYAQLTRLPHPTLGTIRIEDWIKRVVELETRTEVNIQAGSDISIRADGDQIDQLLINLVRNGVDAAKETGGEVTVFWKELDTKSGAFVEVVVRDSGPGITNTENLFVPFFTTKPDGSGIGLVLSRQIAEAHGGSLVLTNRDNEPGCDAVLRLPIHAPA